MPVSAGNIEPVSAPARQIKTSANGAMVPGQHMHSSEKESGSDNGDMMRVPSLETIQEKPSEQCFFGQRRYNDYGDRR